VPIYQHFRENEHPFIDRVLDWKVQVENQFIIYVTEFLNPREREIVRYVIGEQNAEIDVSFFGGVDKAERQRAVIAPYFIPIETEHFELVGLEATYPSKFITLTHRDVLGAFTSLGIDRKMVGDIFVHPDRIHLITTETFKDYIVQQLTNIKSTSVSFHELPLSSIEKIEAQWKKQNYTVSSLRLDVVVRTVYHLSRKNASRLIEAERVHLNYRLETNPATTLEIGDLLSVRGYGRCKLIDHRGKTRKDKIRLLVAHLT